MRRFWVLGAGIALTVSIFVVSSLLAFPGELDSTFDGDGIVITDVATLDNEIIMGIVVDGNGKIVVAGSGGDVVLARYNSDGSLDNSFGKANTGVIHTVTSDTENIQSLGLDSQGRIIVAGINNTTNSSGILLQRYTSDGVLDTTFSDDGIVFTDNPIGFDFVSDLAIDNTNRIVVVGLTNSDQFVARYLVDGTLDNSFEGDGIVVTDVNGEYSDAQGVKIQTDGRIVVVGTHLNGALITRYLDDGSLDLTFSDDGIVITTSPDAINLSAFELTLDTQGRIIIVGDADHSAGRNAIIIRYTAEGDLDSTFGDGNGIILPDAVIGKDEGTTAVNMDAEGRIVASGLSYNDGKADWLVFRFNPDGMPDPSFGVNGVVDDIYSNEYEFTYSSTIDAEGKILIAGRTSLQDHGHNFMVARLEGNGPIVTPTATLTPSITPPATPTDVPLLADFVNDGSFEQGNLDFWKVKNIPGNPRKCNKPDKPPVSYHGECAFRFKNHTAASKILQVVNLSTETFNPGDVVEFNAYFKAPKNPLIGRANLKIIYKNGDKEKVENLVNASVEYSGVAREVDVLSNDVQKIKIIILTNSDQLMYVDAIRLLLFRPEDFSGSIPLPLPVNP